MDLHLSGKTAVVTGTSRGIGFAITKALVDAGVHVVAASRTPGKGLPALQETGQVSFVPVDLSQPGAAEELVAVATERGGIDILVNNVGGATVHAGGLVSLSDDEWQAAWDLNVMAAVRSARAALPEIERCGGGSIVIIGSISAYLANPETYAYCVTKAGLAKFSKALSIELAPKNIRVNLVSPGAVLTEIWTNRGRMAAEYAAADGRTAEEVRATIIESTPTGRLTTPEQVASADTKFCDSHISSVSRRGSGRFTSKARRSVTEQCGFGIADMFCRITCRSGRFVFLTSILLDVMARAGSVNVLP